MNRSGPLRRRTRLRSIGRKRRHRIAEYGQVWRWAMERAGWRCEVVIDSTRCPARVHLHAHHLLPRSHGGPDELGNLLVACSFHHALIHREPTWAYEVGYLRRRAS